MIIPYTLIPSEILDRMLEDFVSRNGTDNGHESTEEQRKAELLGLLDRQEVFISYNQDYEQTCLVPRHEVSAEMLRSILDLTESFEAEDTEAKERKNEIEARLNDLRSTELIPLQMNEIEFSHGIYSLLDNGKLHANHVSLLVERYRNGDFGVICDDDVLANLRSVADKDYMLDRYNEYGQSIYIEALSGWSVTMVMLVSER